MTIFNVSEQHPDYRAMGPRWVAGKDAYDGEVVVKSRRETYLPPTPGMEFDGMGDGQPGRKAYDKYLLRAVFPDYVPDAINTSLGVLWSSVLTMELPPELEYLREKATPNGLTLIELLAALQMEILTTGRAGLLPDLPAGEIRDIKPLISFYKGLDITNWDDDSKEADTANLTLCVLNESGFEREGFTWNRVDKHRVLQLVDGKYNISFYKNNTQQWEHDFILRGAPIDKVPFIFCGASSTKSEPGEIPFDSLIRLCYSIYRGEADYRQALFLQGQDTLVVIGNRNAALGQEDNETRVGAGAVLNLTLGSDAKYVGVESEGLSELRMALENDKELAQQRSGRFLASSTGTAESGVAIAMRRNAQTVSLKQISESSASALRKALVFIAEWVGADPTKIVINQQLDLGVEGLSGDELLKLAQSRSLGAPLSMRSIHGLMRRRGLTTISFEEELELLEAEGGLGIGMTGSTNGTADNNASDDQSSDDVKVDDMADNMGGEE